MKFIMSIYISPRTFLNTHHNDSTNVRHVPLLSQPSAAVSRHTVCLEGGLGHVTTDTVLKYIFTRMYDKYSVYWQHASKQLIKCKWFLKPPFTQYNLLSNRFHNRVNVCIHDTTGCQTRPAWQPVVCLFTWYSRLANRLYNWFDNQLCTTGLTTSCIV